MRALTISSETANTSQPHRSAFSTTERTRTMASFVDRPLRKPYWPSYSPGITIDKCYFKPAAITLSSSVPDSSNRHTGLKAEGKSGDRRGFGRRTIRPSLHWPENSPQARHLLNRRVRLYRDPELYAFRSSLRSPDNSSSDISSSVFQSSARRGEPKGRASSFSLENRVSATPSRY